MSRGSVTELYGPPGVGKTTFALQLAVNALNTLGPSNGVVWIDTGAPLPGPRFNEIFSAYQVLDGHDLPSSPPEPKNGDEVLDKICYFAPQTLAHLLVMFLHPTAKFPPAGASLIVVDNISALFTTSFPRHTKTVSNQSFADAHRDATLNKAANRKWAIAGDFASAMSKMARLKNVAILVINQVSTSVKGGHKATLKPTLTGREWDAGIQDRIMLYRDFAPRDGEVELTEEERKGLRFAEVVKAGGKMQTARTEDITAFVIEDVSWRAYRHVHGLTCPSTGYERSEWLLALQLLCHLRRPTQWPKRARTREKPTKLPIARMKRTR